MCQLAREIQDFVRTLRSAFPTLANWTADEMSLHRYDHPDVGLSFHKDNLRFVGLIAVATIEGERDLEVKAEDGSIVTLPMYTGSLALTRATDLIPGIVDSRGKKVNLCPDHAVTNLRTPTSTSFIVRANSRPNDEVPGFEYANWPA